MGRHRREVGSSLPQLEKRSVAIALVRVEQSTLNLGPAEEQIPTPKGDDAPLGNTLSKVVVEKVYKSDGRITDGAEYTVIEYYTTWVDPSDPNTTRIYAHGNTYPMVEGGEYLLFLDPASHDYGDYEIFGLWLGKYKVSEEIKAAASVGSLSKEQLEAARDSGEDPVYWQLAQEVKDKYLNGR
jgi:hypothetical protein